MNRPASRRRRAPMCSDGGLLRRQGGPADTRRRRGRSPRLRPRLPARPMVNSCWRRPSRFFSALRTRMTRARERGARGAPESTPDQPRPRTRRRASGCRVGRRRACGGLRFYTLQCRTCPRQESMPPAPSRRREMAPC
jgi:hypothetical protein